MFFFSFKLMTFLPKRISNKISFQHKSKNFTYFIFKHFHSKEEKKIISRNMRKKSFHLRRAISFWLHEQLHSIQRMKWRKLSQRCQSKHKLFRRTDLFRANRSWNCDRPMSKCPIPIALMRQSTKRNEIEKKTAVKIASKLN